jgi:putative flavoprotein involved in K+ transport
MREPERIPIVIIGAGQAGLSVGYHLARQGLSFVILEANQRVGGSWRARWDSLRLFTPARFDGIAGLPFPARPNEFPTKDEMADYLEGYAKRFQLPVRTGVRVTRLSRRGDRYLVETTDSTYEAEHVVVAMATFQQRRVPAFARELAPDIVQLHSSHYRNLSQLRSGGVLIVGAGNSGAEIAMETARGGHATWVSGRDTGGVPFRLDSLLGRLLVPFVFRVIFHRVLTTSTPVGRKARPAIVAKGGPLIRVKQKDLAAAGVERVPRTRGVENGRPVLENGRVLDVENVIWCTGFDPGFSWIDLPIIFDKDGDPVQQRGIVPDEPGLYFVGLHFLYALSSTMIHGVGRDAEHVARAIATRQARGRMPLVTTRSRRSSFASTSALRDAPQHSRPRSAPASRGAMRITNSSGDSSVDTDSTAAV